MEVEDNGSTSGDIGGHVGRHWNYLLGGYVFFTMDLFLK